VATLRGEVTRAIEPKRKAGEIGHSLETAVTLYLPDDVHAAVSSLDMDLREVCIVSKVILAKAADAPADATPCETVPGAFVGVARAPGDKCGRCWTYSEELGASAGHPDLCPRCAAVLHAQGL